MRGDTGPYRQSPVTHNPAPSGHGIVAEIVADREVRADTTLVTCPFGLLLIKYVTRYPGGPRYKRYPPPKRTVRHLIFTYAFTLVFESQAVSDGMRRLISTPTPSRRHRLSTRTSDQPFNDLEPFEASVLGRFLSGIRQKHTFLLWVQQDIYSLEKS